MSKQKPFLFLVLISLLISCELKTNERIITVNGEMLPKQMGKTLAHEHILVDFIRNENNRSEAYSTEEAMAHVLSHLEKLKAYGVNTFVECTPIYIGRDVRLLKKISDETGLQILTNTGFYGAQDNRFIPEYTLTMTASMISTFWIAEFDQGIDGTGIRPGFIKIGVNRKPLSDFHATLVRAAALTHKATGLTIMSHTGPAVSTFQQLNILKEENVSPEAFIWAHASDENDWSQLIKAAKMGAWISLDKYGWKEEYAQSYPRILKLMKKEGVLNKALVSHDAGWFDPGQPEHPFKPYTPFFEELIPRLKKEGFSTNDIKLLLEKNPAKALVVKKRLINKL